MGKGVQFNQDGSTYNNYIFLFKNLRILNLKDIYKLQIGKFMYQCKSGLLPDSFVTCFW